MKISIILKKKNERKKTLKGKQTPTEERSLRRDLLQRPH